MFEKKMHMLFVIQPQALEHMKFLFYRTIQLFRSVMINWKSAFETAIMKIAANTILWLRFTSTQTTLLCTCKNINAVIKSKIIK